MIKQIWHCLFSPRLFKVYQDGPRDSVYHPQGLEKWGDKIITSVNTIMNIGIYTSPFICIYMYKRGFFSLEEAASLTRFFGGIGILIAFSFLLRGIGRASNAKYIEFLSALSAPMTDKKAYLDGIRKYDFEFHAWPVTFKMAPCPPKPMNHPFSNCANEDLPLYQRTFIQVLAYFAVHTFGLRMIYPGSLGLIHTMLWSALLQGRTILVESFSALRAKILTADGNEIDTMFVDHRNKTSRGDILVVCCEGNSGFYEIGIVTTPTRAGYSTLGWNHPGFAGSTGVPYPYAEHNAIDAVMQYALQELGFQPENIVLFGWSIGGYSAAWAAVNYPDVKALILDATFDDLLPLALNQMPSSWSRLVREVVRSHVNLNVAEALKKYGGPIHTFRRTEDEIICLRQGQLSTNRGNNLVISIISTRHPDLSSETMAQVTKYISLLDSQRAAIERNEGGHSIPIRLISKYMRDYKSSHCYPLPEDQFQAVMDDVLFRKKTN